MGGDAVGAAVDASRVGGTGGQVVGLVVVVWRMAALKDVGRGGRRRRDHADRFNDRCSGGSDITRRAGSGVGRSNHGGRRSGGRKVGKLVGVGVAVRRWSGTSGVTTVTIGRVSVTSVTATVTVRSRFKLVIGTSVRLVGFW